MEKVNEGTLSFCDSLCWISLEFEKLLRIALEYILGIWEFCSLNQEYKPIIIFGMEIELRLV